MRCIAIGGWSRPSSRRAATTASRSRATRIPCCQMHVIASRKRTRNTLWPRPRPPGMVASRRAWALSSRQKGLAEYHEFPGLKAFGRIEATRVIDGRTESDIRIFVLSRKLTAQALLETARDHWGIETRLHWQLDVSFGEDAARNRKDNGPANIAVIRRRALDVARLDQS